MHCKLCCVALSIISRLNKEGCRDRVPQFSFMFQHQHQYVVSTIIQSKPLFICYMTGKMTVGRKCSRCYNN